MRTKVYDSILELLADRRWHGVDELREITPYSELWLKELKKDSYFEVDEGGMRMRLADRAFLAST